jgi:hypothetical protein
MPRRLHAGRLLLAGLVAYAAACGTAHPPPPPTAVAPIARLGAALAGDPADGDLVLFGGRTRSGVEGDTWTWTAGRWRRVATPAAPAPRSFAAAAPDGRGGVILFGGDVSDPTGTHDDTWRWDGRGWRPLHPRTVPDAGAFRTMAPGPASGGPVLVVFRADRAVRTWTWDATAAPDGDWVPAPGPAAPPWRDDSGLVPDRPSHRLLLVGGIPEQGLRASDTWAWDETSWAELHPAHRPGGGPVSVTDLATGPLLYEEDGTWTWGGGDWTLVRPPGAPSWRPYAALAAIPGPATRGAEAILLTGAAGDAGQTWRWNGRAWVQS